MEMSAKVDDDGAEEERGRERGLCNKHWSGGGGLPFSAEERT